MKFSTLLFFTITSIGLMGCNQAGEYRNISGSINDEKTFGTGTETSQGALIKQERDENGEVTGIMVMGAFGSMTSDKMYFEIIDCENYETQQDCEDESLTQSVCMWYEWPEPYGDICLPKKLPNLD